MKALAVFPAKREVRLVDHPEPQLTSPTQVKFQVVNVGICGTDREIWSFKYGSPPAGSDYLITGHECLGQVVEVGSAVQDFKVGDYVVPTVRRGCPENCISCANDQPDFCFTGHFSERGIKGAHGYTTEFVVDDQKYMTLIPLEIRDIAVLLEPLTITEKALIQIYEIQSRLPWECRIDQGIGEETCHRALLLGAGPVGCLAAMVFRNLGMKTFVTARHPQPNEKADWLEGIGATYFSTEKMKPEQIAEQIGRIDVVLEATGAAKAAFDFLPVLGTNGIFIFTGVPDPKTEMDLDVGTLMRNIVLKNQVVLGTVNAPKQAFSDGVKNLQEFVKKWPKHPQALITDRFTIDQWQSVVSGNNPKEIKTIFRFEEAAVPH